MYFITSSPSSVLGSNDIIIPIFRRSKLRSGGRMYPVQGPTTRKGWSWNLDSSLWTASSTFSASLTTEEPSLQNTLTYSLSPVPCPVHLARGLQTLFPAPKFPRSCWNGTDASAWFSWHLRTGPSPSFQPRFPQFPQVYPSSNPASLLPIPSSSRGAGIPSPRIFSLFLLLTKRKLQFYEDFFQLSETIPMSPFSEFPFCLTHSLVYDYSLWISYVSFIFPKFKFLENTKNKTKTGKSLSRHEAA